MTKEVALVPATSDTVIDRGAALATADVIERTKKIREVMEAVMKPNVHYGVIPGTGKPTMYQPGADVLAVTFRIAPRVAEIVDLSTGDEVRYRVTMQGVHQVTGDILADGVGSCSSNEEKYRWRKPVVDQEWEETDTDRRRQKWMNRGGGKAYQQKQVRTSPVDVDNTVLKMAVKRAKIAMILNATAASDVFAQDLEDLTDELRESLTDEQSAAPVPQPKRKEKPAETPAPPPPDSRPTVEVTVPPADWSPIDPAGVVVADLERRRSQATGTNYWIVRDHKGGIYFCPESGEHWEALVDVLKKIKEAGTRVEFDTEQPDGQKFPTITGITPRGQR